MSVEPSVEVEFFSDSDVLVTNARFVFKGTVYAVSKIKSLNAVYEPPTVEKQWKLIKIMFFMVFSGVAIILFMAGFALISDPNSSSTNFTLGTVMGLIPAGICIYTYSRPHIPKHQINVHFSFSDIVSIKSADQKYLENILTALNSAIVYRG